METDGLSEVEKQKRIAQRIGEIADRNGWLNGALCRKRGRKRLPEYKVRMLRTLFDARVHPTIIANELQISKTTIYNYTRIWKADDDQGRTRSRA